MKGEKKLISMETRRSLLSIRKLLLHKTEKFLIIFVNFVRITALDTLDECPFRAWQLSETRAMRETRAEMQNFS